MANTLEKLIELINKTGDRCIILDHHGNPAFVLVPFKDYENLGKSEEIAGLTEEELLNKINHDIAFWRSTQEGDQSINWQVLEQALEEAKNTPEPINSPEAEDPFVVEPVQTEEIEEKQVNQAKKKPSEDQYYFEPID